MEKEESKMNLKDEAAHLLDAIRSGDVEGFAHSLQDFVGKCDEAEDMDEGEAPEEEPMKDAMAAGSRKSMPAEEAVRKY